MARDARSMREIEAALCRSLAAVFCDLDDTVTTGGKISANAFTALWRLHEAGLAVVVVTGRPAGWADHLARMWPVHGVIGENGGLYFRYTGGAMRRYFAYSAEERTAFRTRLDRIGEEILQAVPGAAIAADQPYREFDLAVDVAEDVPHLPPRDVQRIQQIFQIHGARAKISSIHVNGWFGDFDKLTTTKRYLGAELGLDPEAAKSRVMFIGDSPNDEPMFSFFPNAVGVAGLTRFADCMTAWPAFVTESAGGTGFAEAVDVILKKRGR